MRKVFSGVIALIMLLLPIGTALADSGQYTVSTDKLYFREKASSESARLATLSKGTAVTVLSTSGDWAKARWNGETGYLALKYLDKVTKGCTEGSYTTRLSGKATVTKGTHLYRSADTESETVKALSAGTSLSLQGETLNFYYVKADGKTGYVLKSRTGASAASSEKSGGQSEILSQGSEGEQVKQLQGRLRKLGYLEDEDVTGHFGSKTAKAVRQFQKLAGLCADGVVGPATRSKLESDSAPKKKKIVEMDWYDSNVSSLVAKRGGTAVIIDCRTGIRINIRRVGGSSHMDVEPASEDDTEKLLKIYGGSWSWSRRPVILVAGGKYIAASINGMPHGAQISDSNGYEGQFCLHTTNSRTHGTDRVDSGHQSCIEQALDYLS